MPRVVLDTNVLVAALITPRGVSARLLLELQAGAFELIVSPVLLDELRAVLHRDRFRAYVSAEDADAFVAVLARDAIVVDAPTIPDDLMVDDPDDAFLVALARAGRADVIVSGDAQVLALRGRLSVATPAEFLASLDD